MLDCSLVKECLNRLNVLYKFYCRGFQKAVKEVVKHFDWTEPALIKGAGSVVRLADEVRNNHVDSVLIVTDKGISKLGLTRQLLVALNEHGIRCTVYDDTNPDPSIENVEQARRVYIDNGCKGIIAFGGGSPMDCAKTAAARIARPDKPVEKMRMPLAIRKPLPPLFAVPTTAGTGSETSIAAVVSNARTKEKFAIMDPVLRPKYAVLDAELTVGLPQHITSTTGMDALTHAVEAYIGKSNTPETSLAAEKAVKLIFENLLTAYTDGKNLTARENMLEAAYYAGLAFTRAYVGYVHAIAHCLGGAYHIPHGLGNAVALPYVLDAFGASAHERLARLAVVAGIVTTEKTDEQKALLFIEKIRELNRQMSIPEGFDAIKPSDVAPFAKRAFKEGNPMYPVPRIFSLKEFEDLFNKLRANNA